MRLVSLIKREEAIQLIKSTFCSELKQALNLIQVSSPIAILDGTGINDDLNGVERPVRFPVKSLGENNAVVVHSLAKWKRMRLKELGIPMGQGIITDMRALRPDEDYSPMHSIYVDQWDWEARIDGSSRSLKFLKETVSSIFRSFRNTAKIIEIWDSTLKSTLPEQIHFIHAEELLQLYPDLTPKERENRISRQFGAVFLIGIGGKLSNGEPHDGRAPDYDDWSSINEEGFDGLNGDLIVWNPVLQQAFEISSMGIRVDRNALLRQLYESESESRLEYLFHKQLIANDLPLSIGGGIGQSRMCMFLLKRQHIGEVQVGIWPDVERQKLRKIGVTLL